MKNLIFSSLCLLCACSHALDFGKAEFRTDSANTKLTGGYFYEFNGDQYTIDFVDENAIPLTRYRVEQGTFQVEKANITLTPELKLYCSIVALGDYFDCTTLTPMSNARYVTRDTAGTAWQTSRGFATRSMPVLRSVDKVVIVDDAVSGSPLVLER